MIARRRIPTHRPPWKRHSPQAVRLSQLYGEVTGIADTIPSGTRQRDLMDHAARCVRLALRATTLEDNRS